MGYGVPASVAAALRFKDRPVVCVAGDGDFLMNGQELATAAQYGADLLIVLVDNGSYGTIRMHQEIAYKTRVHGTELKNPDFARWGESFGARGLTIASIEEAPAVVDKALAHEGPVVVDVRTAIEHIAPAATIASLQR
jgi:acetolactate synthase I/II/III large subunit